MKKGLIYLVVFSVLFLSMCGCAQSDETTSQKETIVKQERTYDYKDYCAQYPQFADFASDTTELYWTIDATDETSGQKIAAIHCTNEEDYYLLQVGNTFWRYDYPEYYEGVYRFCTFSVNAEMFYAFDMCRYISTGGFFVRDLLLVSPSRANQIYAVTVDNAYDTVASKMQIAYNKDTQELTVKDSKKTTILPLPNKKTVAYDDGVAVEKELQFTDLYVQMSRDASNEKWFCWNYKIDGSTIYIQTTVFANYRFADDTYNGYWDYHEEYEEIGEVRTQILFDGENISFGDAVFTPS